MNDFLIMMTFLFSWLHQKEDRIAVLSFSASLLLFGFFDELIPQDQGTIYFLLAAWIDLAIIFYISRLTHSSELIYNIQLACEAFIYVNFCGWVAYMRYIPPLIYNYTCSIIYFWVLAKIIDGSSWRGFRNLAMDRGNSWFHSGNYTGDFASVSNKKAHKK